MPLALDHLVICVPSLQEGVRYAHEKGLASVSGGRHTGHGTANRIVPLGDSYLELVAVVDDSEAEDSPFGSWVADPGRSGIGVDAICLRTDDLDGVCDRLDLESTPMSRLRPDGLEMSWRIAGLDEALRDGVPFFIEWGVPEEELPGRFPIEHPAGAVSVEEVVLTGESGRLERWTQATEGIRIRDGAPGVESVTMVTSSGSLVL